MAADCAGVGQNLQDHLCYDHFYRSRVPTLNDVLRPWRGRIQAGLQYLHPASAVVDARLRVHGMEGVRVADASIFPVITSGNTNAPAIMVGEQAARMVLQDAV